MIDFIKKYWQLLIGLILVIYIITLRTELKEKNEIIYFKDSVIKVGETTYKSLAEKYINQVQANNDLKRYNDSLSQKLKDANEQLKGYAQIILQYKKQVFSHVDSIKVYTLIGDTIKVKVGDDIVKISEENTVVKVTGQTHLYPEKGYELEVEPKDINLDIVVSTDANGNFMTYLDTKNPDLSVKKLNVRYLKDEPSFWSKLYGIGSVNIGIKGGNHFIDFGVGYNRWGIKGHLGYKDFKIDKENQNYGFGVMYKLF